jgi:type II secretory pathway pseudopilin PulG
MKRCRPVSTLNLLWGRGFRPAELPLGAAEGETEAESVEIAELFASKRLAEARRQSSSSAPLPPLEKCKWHCCFRGGVPQALPPGLTCVVEIDSRSGITLIEVLIAVSLLSLLSVGMLIAMRLGFNTMEKTDAHLVQNRKVVNVRQIIENEIDGFISTLSEWHRDPQNTFLVPFRQFEPSSMRFVTSYSLQDAWRGRLQIAALQVVPGEGNVGVRLIVNETPYTGPAQAGSMIAGLEPDPSIGTTRTLFVPITAGSQSFVLADKLAYCRFTYLEPRFVPPLRLWRPDWVQPTTLPLGIRIEMASLANKPAEVQMSTITATLPVNLKTLQRFTDGQ